jgi:isopentenyl-diphosphate delta-isomerase
MPINKNRVVLVNDHDEWLGTADKIEVHQTGALHRALSIFITNSNGQMLLQQRAADKYHSGGLWSNACCSHPSPGESTMAAAHRRLNEELGFDTQLLPVTRMKYKAEVTAGLTEYEYDHIFSGTWDGDVIPEPGEVATYRWINLDDLYKMLLKEPQSFTAWFPILLDGWKNGVAKLSAAKG